MVYFYILRFLPTYMFVWSTFVHMHLHVCVHMCAIACGSLKLTLRVILDPLSASFIDRTSQWNQELASNSSQTVCSHDGLFLTS